MSPLCEQLQITHPIIQAPMAGGATTPELVAAVSNAGGLGSIGAAYLQPNDLKVAIEKVQSLTDKPFAVNLFVPPVCAVSQSEQLAMRQRLTEVAQPLSVEIHPVDPPFIPDFEDQLEVILNSGVQIFSFVFGVLPAHYMEQLKSNDVFVMGTATSVQEAHELSLAGVNAVVAQGIEAGGHRGTFPASTSDQKSSTLDLVRAISEDLAIPVIGAGGVAKPEDHQAVLDSGASASQVGTAFLTTHEAGTHPTHKQVLLSQTDDQTVMTKAFSGRYARGVENAFIRSMAEYESEVLPFPAQNKLSKQMRAAAAEQNNAEFMSLWAGQSVAVCQAVSAGELVELLCYVS